MRASRSTILAALAIALAASSAEAQDTPYCNMGQEYDAGLCYAYCNSGYDGVGPVCWEECGPEFIDDGAFCRIDAIINAKDSYGRGVGVVPTLCPAGHEMDGALCYPDCRANYNGVGPVCWEICAAGYTDDGATCRRDVHIFAKNSSGCPPLNLCCASCPAGYVDDGCFCRRPAHIYGKDSYGRGAGDPPSVCLMGAELDAGLCYPYCREGYSGVGPVCWEDCPPDFIDDGAFCRQDAIILAKDSYGRGVGVVPQCDAQSFTRGTGTSSTTLPFSMIIASDTQLPWGTDPSCTASAQDCEIEFGTRTNRWFTQSMNSITTLGTWPAHVMNSGGNVVQTPEGVIINGDLTAFWHPWQVALYRKFYDPQFAEADPDVLQLPLFPGLGNHDYANNANDCWGEDPVDWLRYGADSCAVQATRYMRGGIGCGTISNFDASKLRAGDMDTLAYSWDVGGWHFVQLHNYPVYEFGAGDILPSLNWLEADLRRATADGLKIVLNMHDHGQHWSMSDAGFQQAIAGTYTVAVFAGHLHSLSGRVATVPSTQIPIFLSGAAERSTFLLVEFGADYFTVGVVDTTNGVPSWRTPGSPASMDTYPVGAPPITNPMDAGTDAGTTSPPAMDSGIALDVGAPPYDSGVHRLDTGVRGPYDSTVYRYDGGAHRVDTGVRRLDTGTSPAPQPRVRHPDDAEAPVDDDGCGCTATQRRGGSHGWLVLMVIAVALRKRNLGCS